MIVKEVCVDNLNDAVRAYEAGANRIEYCSDLDQDGLTPNLDELLTLSKTIPIPIRCMLRPHSNSFVYNNNDIKKIIKTILQITSLLLLDQAMEMLFLLHLYVLRVDLCLLLQVLEMKE